MSIYKSNNIIGSSEKWTAIVPPEKYNNNTEKLILNSNGLFLLQEINHTNLWSIPIESIYKKELVGHFAAGALFGAGVAKYLLIGGGPGGVALLVAGFIIGGVITTTSYIALGPQYYHQLVLTDEGILKLYMDTYNSRFDYKTAKHELLWKSDDANGYNRKLLFEDRSLTEYVNLIHQNHYSEINTIYDNVILDSDDDFTRFGAINSNESHVFSNAFVFPVDDIEIRHHSQEPDEISAINSFGYIPDVDSHYKFNDELHTIDLVDLEGNLLHRSGENCIRPFTENQNIRKRILLEDNADITVELNGVNYWKYTNHQTECHFPTSGQSNLEVGQELIQHNLLPKLNSNDMTYLLSEDGKMITIKDGEQIKVISKDDFNGNFQTSPTVQVFDLN